MAEGYVFTYRQRTGGKKTDKQVVTHLRQVHSCRRLQRDGEKTQGEGGRERDTDREKCARKRGVYIIAHKHKRAKTKKQETDLCSWILCMHRSGWLVSVLRTVQVYEYIIHTMGQ